MDSPVSETEKREAQELLRFLFAEKLMKKKRTEDVVFFFPCHSGFSRPSLVR